MLEQIKNIVRKELKDSAHDFDHTMRVYRNCMLIAREEPSANMEILQAASLLHDIARVKEAEDASGKTDHAILGAEMAQKILLDAGYGEKFAETVKSVISTHRYRADNPPVTIEAKILFDADKLDALGAIGIARSFAIAGQVGERLYCDSSVEEYARENLVGGDLNGRIIDAKKHSFQMEYAVKFRHLPEKMYTDTAKKIAWDRLRFMEAFIEKMTQEVHGEN